MMKPASEAKTSGTLLHRAVDWLFGHDYFISYAHADGVHYPTALSEKLQKGGFNVFLDKAIYVAGDELRRATRRRVRMSRKLIVLARPAALNSEWVRREIATHLATGKTPVIININRAIQDEPSRSGLAAMARERDWLRIEEDLEEIDGTPTDYCVSELIRSFGAMRQEAKRLRFFAFAAVAFAVVAGLAVAGGFLAVQQRGVADARGRVAVSRQLAAYSSEKVSSQLDLGLLLALTAEKMSPTFEARTSLLQALLRSGRRQAVISAGHQITAPSVLSPDGKIIAHTYSTWKGAWIVLSESTSGKERTSFFEPGDWPYLRHLAFSPDGKSILSTSPDGQKVVLWDIETSKKRVVLDLEQGQDVDQMAVSPVGQLLGVVVSETVRGIRGSRIVVWDLSENALKHQLHPAWNYEFSSSVIDFSPDGSMLAATVDGGIALWNMTSGRRETTLKGGAGMPAWTLAFGPGGKLLVSGGEDGKVVLWDVATYQRLRDAHGHEHYVGALAFGPDGLMLASGSRDKRIILWDVATLEKQAVMVDEGAEEGGVWSLAFTPDGGSLVSSSEFSPAIVWDASGDPLRVILPDLDGRMVVFNPDGTTLAGNTGEGILLWDLQAHERLAILPATVVSKPSMVPLLSNQSVAFDHSGRVLAVADSDGVVLWSFQRDKHIRLEKIDNDKWDLGSAVAFSPDGKILALQASNRIRLWDTVRRTEILSLDEGPNITQDLSFSPDGQTLAAGGMGEGFKGAVVLWDLGTGERRLQLEELEDVVHSVAYSPDGKLLATASRQLILWNAATGERVAELDVSLMMSPENLVTVEGSEIVSVAFDPTGRILASGTGQGQVTLWDVDSGQRILSLGACANDGRSASVEFSPDGGTLGVGCLGGAVTLWNIDFSSWKKRACAIANRNLTLQEWRIYVGLEWSYEAACPNWPVLPGPSSRSVQLEHTDTK
ncbi:MAG: PQQ-binding-like beta-propeller repeat protein [Desulfobacteria bacterium]